MLKYLILFLPLTVFASGSHHEPVNVVIEHNTLSTKTETLSTKGIASSVAASQHHFDFGTHSWQGSIGVGAFDSEAAISFGVAKRLDRVLVNGSISREDGEFGGGVGVNWRF